MYWRIDNASRWHILLITVIHLSAKENQRNKANCSNLVHGDLVLVTLNWLLQVVEVVAHHHVGGRGHGCPGGAVVAGAHQVAHQIGRATRGVAATLANQGRGATVSVLIAHLGEWVRGYVNVWIDNVEYII